MALEMATNFNKYPVKKASDYIGCSMFGNYLIHQHLMPICSSRYFTREMIRLHLPHYLGGHNSLISGLMNNFIPFIFLS